MKLTQNVKAVSRISLILLLLISFVIGTFLSYLWVIGGVLELGITIPEKPTVAITNVSFTPQDTGFFNVTLLVPSYSPSDANITRIDASTEDGLVHNITNVTPLLPYKLQKATRDFPGNQTFECLWNWANYTGQTVRISAFVENGSGPTFEALTPFVGLQVTNVCFNLSVSVSYFNLTIQNNENSVTHVNITDITVQTTTLSRENVTPPLPYILNSNSSATFKCPWDWTYYQNTTVTISVHTSEGYTSYITHFTQKPTILEVTDALFSETDTNHFNITIRNSELSPNFIDVSKITLSLQNETVVEINGTEMEPSLPYTLNPNSSMTFECPWNWTDYRRKSVTLTVHTLQNYTIKYTTITPSPIRIVDVPFDLLNTNSFNLTVRNSEFYTAVNLTVIDLVLENGTTQNINGTETIPQLPYKLEPNSTTTFICPWNWSDYQGKNLTILVHSAENYIEEFTKVTPTRVFFAIVSVVFDLIDTKNFNVTVRNSEFSFDNAYIAKIAVTLENGTVIEISGVLPVLPYTINLNATVTFQCAWDWTNHRNENIIISVYIKEGNKASTQYTTPPAYP